MEIAVSIIIVNYNTTELLDDSIGSVQSKTESVDYEHKFLQVKSIFDELNIFKLTENKINFYIDSAIRNVENLTISDKDKTYLIDFAQQLAQRIK